MKREEIMMKTGKRIFWLLMASLLAVTLFAAQAAAESGTYEGLTWTLENGVLTVNGQGNFPAKGPWMEYAKKIKSIEIGDEIEDLATKALDGFPELTYVHFGKGIDGIGWPDFGSVPKLKTLRFSGPINGFAVPIRVNEIIFEDPEATKTVDGDLVTGTSGSRGLNYVLGDKKGTVVLPEDIVSIGMYSFSDMKNMKAVILPEKMWSGIYNYAFQNCTSLKSITIPEKCHDVSEGAFSGCKSLKQVLFLCENTDLKKTFINCTGLEEVVLPAVTKLQADLFNGATSLKKIVLAEGTESIGKNTFRGCEKVKSIYIPASVTEIDEEAFDLSLTKLKYQCQAGSYAETFLKEHGLKYETVKLIESVTLSESELSLNGGKSATLKAEVLPKNATDKKALIWASSNELVATVKDGKVKAVGGGACRIFCISADGSNLRAVCELTVTEKIKSIKVPKKYSMKVGKTWQPEVEIKPATASNQTLIWKSSDESVCTVDENGVITAVAAGKCEIFCETTDGSKLTGKIKITVK